ncbi:hypothetical protein SAMN04489712_10478 [Thermomonospora echinospora]|uniref:Neocarzinostatin family protein n=1 Tax=Thermomonospora echinospora TaxID=1992 RepID=A0A1H5YNH8_9ACTN|nr:hypothetical protein [Thermomonospora echinospora]SEG24926.1 hypothetical protein SAMN04489712_10478 [Thermomonospora echinospora]
MKLASMLVGLAAGVSAIAFTATPAHAAGTVSGTVSVNFSPWNVTCSWTNATTSDVPPNTLTISHTSINSTISCTGGIALTVTSSPTVTFSGGNATIVSIDVAVQTPSCAYRVSNATLLGPGPTYTGTDVPAVEKDPKRFLCPDNVTMGTVSLAF